ncbi:MAG: DMT family transporter [Bacteroides sp.]|nr:DMT family transporter [Bacteroides sp.]
MWIILALISALCLGFYDVFKKLSLKANDVLTVLMLNTVFGTLYMSPFLIIELSHGNFGFSNTLTGHLLILAKSVIVLSSWLLGYYAIKHLPLTIQGPINASRPVIVLVGALIIFGERLNWVQWIGILLGFASLFFISRIGAKEGFSLKHSKWIWMSIGATALGAISALYDKFLMKYYQPIDVQAWYSLYQCFIMVIAISIIKGGKANIREKFTWRWTIPCIALFLTIADLAYFYSLSIPGSMVAVVSMIRRGSVIVSFIYGVVALHEKNIKPKLIDLAVLMVSLALLVIGSNL